MIHQIIRDSNKIWKSMYYDNLIDSEYYQISLTKNADRLYLNCAHALSNDEESILTEIENIFFENNIIPAIYCDPESPKGLEEKLVTRGYKLIDEELENWHAFSLNKDAINDIQSNSAKNPGILTSLEIKLFNPKGDKKLFAQFLELDQLANNIPSELLSKLENKLLTPQDNTITFICCFALMDGLPASSGLIAIYNDCAFFSEGATHPNFRHQGLYTEVRKASVLISYKVGCHHAIANCDRYAYSNHTYQKLGFKKIFSRSFYQLND